MRPSGESLFNSEEMAKIANDSEIARKSGELAKTLAEGRVAEEAEKARGNDLYRDVTKKDEIVDKDLPIIEEAEAEELNASTEVASDAPAEKNTSDILKTLGYTRIPEGTEGFFGKYADFKEKSTPESRQKYEEGLRNK